MDNVPSLAIVRPLNGHIAAILNTEVGEANKVQKHIYGLRPCNRQLLKICVPVAEDAHELPKGPRNAW